MLGQLRSKVQYWKVQEGESIRACERPLGQIYGLWMRHGHENGMGCKVSMALGKLKARHLAWHGQNGTNQKQSQACDHGAQATCLQGTKSSQRGPLQAKMRQLPPLSLGYDGLPSLSTGQPKVASMVQAPPLALIQCKVALFQALVSKLSYIQFNFK